MCPCCCCQVDRETMKPDSLSEESGSRALRRDRSVIRHAAVRREAGLEGEHSFALSRTPTVGACSGTGRYGPVSGIIRGTERCAKL